MDGGGRLHAELVVDELGCGLALERVAVRRAQVAGVRRVAIRVGQRRPRVRRRDRGQACGGERRDAADGLVRAGRAHERDDRLVGCELWAAVAPPAGVHRPSSVVRGSRVPRTLPVQVVDGELDAVLGVLPERRVGAGEDAPEGDMERLTGRDIGCRARSGGAAGRWPADGAVTQSRYWVLPVHRRSGRGGRDEHCAERERAELHSIHRDGSPPTPPPERDTRQRPQRGWHCVCPATGGPSEDDAPDRQVLPRIPCRSRLRGRDSHAGPRAERCPPMRCRIIADGVPIARWFERPEAFAARPSKGR